MGFMVNIKTVYSRCSAVTKGKKGERCVTSTQKIGLPPLSRYTQKFHEFIFLCFLISLPDRPTGHFCPIVLVISFKQMPPTPSTLASYNTRTHKVCSHAPTSRPEHPRTHPPTHPPTSRCRPTRRCHFCTLRPRPSHAHSFSAPPPSIVDPRPPHHTPLPVPFSTKS